MSQSSCVVTWADGNSNIEMIIGRKKENSVPLMFSLSKIKEHGAEMGESRTGNTGEKELLCVRA